jgi:ubiquinol-cytochrome c reductase cytochrome b subunit
MRSTLQRTTGSAGRWLDHRLALSRWVLPVLRHPVPRDVNWWYVLGSATLVAFIVQVVTGVALAFTYVPSPDHAYDSLQFISSTAILGRVVRGVHYWGASAMVVLVALHAIRVFLSGSFKFPREMNWVTGVVLLFLTLGMAFTGQLLRWDQDAYWAVAVAAEQAGRTPVIGGLVAQIVVAGKTIGAATLTRFYATHVFLIPALIFATIGVHLYLLLRHGISEPPRAGAPVDPDTYEAEYEAELHRSGIPFWPDAAWRDVIFALGVGVVVLALAIAVGPKALAARADPTNLHADPRPDWYFLWLFALLALIPPKLEDWLIIGLPAVAAGVLFLLPFVFPRGERSPRRRPWAVGSVGVIVIAIGALVFEGHLAPWSPALPPPTLPVAVTAPLQGDAATGAQLFETHGCIACHTIDGTGGQRGPNLSAVGSRLSENELTWRILNGGHNMPSFATTLSPDQVSALVTFLHSRR